MIELLTGMSIDARLRLVAPARRSRGSNFTSECCRRGAKDCGGLRPRWSPFYASLDDARKAVADKLLMSAPMGMM